MMLIGFACVWFFSKTKRQHSEEEDLQRHVMQMSALNVQAQQVCDKILLRTASRTARRSLALYCFVGNYA